jgi:20S proteasome subunit beta 2
MTDFVATSSRQALPFAGGAQDDIAAMIQERPSGGFDFENAIRNNMLAGDAKYARLPKAKKTGTTIAGIQFKGGVVLGADTRATEGPIVADKNCEKIHYMAPNIYCCGAGTSADTENSTGMISSQLELLRLRTGTQSRVVTAMTLLKRMLFRYQGNVSAALVLGGCDVTGAHLYTVWPHGSTDKLPYVTMGSGSLAAMAVFERGYEDNLTEEQAKDLVKDAIKAGIFNDLGSGGNVDICVIRDNYEVEMLRNIETPNEGSVIRAQVKRPAHITMPKGCTAVLKETFESLVVEDAAEPMQL